MNKRKGISLIVLVITILVMIILAGVVVVSLSKNNPIERAKEATFKQDLVSIGEELEMFCVNAKAQDSNFNKETLNADKNNLEYNTKKDSAKNIYAIIPSLSGTKYKNQIEVIQGNLYYKTPNKKEIPWLGDLGIHYTGRVTGTVNIEGDTLIGVSPDYVNTGTLVIPDTVKKILPGAFANCQSIVDVVLPNGLTKIEDNTFNGCSELASVTIPNTVTEIGTYAFKQCRKLKNVNFPTSLEKISYGAFQECSLIEKLDFSNTKLKEVGDFAFYYCVNANELKFSETLESIGSQAFQEITAKEIIIPNNTKNITSSAFISNNALETIKIGPNTNIEESIIRGCANLKNFIVEKNDKYEVVDNILYAKYPNGDKVLQEAAASVGKENGGVIKNLPEDVKVIGYGAFLDNKNITQVILPDNVVTVNSRVFEGCSKLEKVVLPSKAKDIAARIFENANALQDVSFTGGKTENTYYNIDNGVLISKGTKTIVASINNKTQYTVPSYIENIGDFAFTGCTKLQSIDLSKATNLKNMGVYSFLSCTGLKSLDIPGTVEEIGANLCNNCTSLEYITLEEGVTKVPMLFANNCVSLKKVSIPASCTYIDGQAFRGTRNFGNVEISSENSVYKIKNGLILTDNGATLAAVTSAQSKIKVPEGVTKLGKDSLRGNAEGITSVTLPNTLKVIDEYAFQDLVKLGRLVIPSSVTRIESRALENTPSLSEIYISKVNGSIAGCPWGATQGIKAVTWVQN